MTSPFVTFVRFMPQVSCRTRRLLVVGAFGGFPLLELGYAVLVAPNRLSSVAWAPISIALFSMTLVGVVAIYGYARGRADMTADLDERQRRDRDQAWIRAYELLVLVVVAVIGAVTVIASVNGPLTIGMDELTPFVIGIGLYLPLLPSAALTWSEPDLPAEIDEVEPAR